MSKPLITASQISELIGNPKMTGGFITKLMMVKSFLQRCGLSEHVVDSGNDIKFTREGAAVALSYLNKKHVEWSDFSDFIRHAEDED